MPGTVFMETLRRQWCGMILWGIGFGVLGSMQVLLLQDSAMIKQIADLMDSLPPFIVQAFAGGDAQYMATPEGYLATQFYSFALLAFAVYTISVGLDVIANDEEEGQLDLLLSLPLTRTRLILEKVTVYALLTVGVVVITGFGMALAIAVTPAMQVDIGRVWQANLNTLPGALLIMVITVFVSSLTRNRSRVLTITALIVVVSYFLDLLATAAPDSFLGSIRWLSLFRYYNGVFVMRDGLNWGNISILLGSAAILIAGSLYFFNRRDVSV